MAKEKEKEKEKNKDSVKPKDKKKGKLSKKTWIIIGVIIIVAVILIGFWGMQGGESYLSVSEVVKNKGKYLEKNVEVKGTVQKGSQNNINRTFIITDGDNNIQVNYTDILSSDFQEGKDVVVKGKLYELPGLGLVINAKEIEVGCSSKY